MHPTEINEMFNGNKNKNKKHHISNYRDFIEQLNKFRKAKSEQIM